MEVKVFEGSWLHYICSPKTSRYDEPCWSETRIDGTTLHTAWYRRGDRVQFVWGKMKQEFLVPDQIHTASVGQGEKYKYKFTAGRSGIVVAFVYR